MTLENVVQILLTAVSYYLFSSEFFKFSAGIKKEKASWTIRFLSFLLIFAWFIVSSTLELPLVVNWFVFLMILGMAVHLIFSFDFLISYALSLFCVIMGLAVNVFFRSLVSILLEVPLFLFDKRMSPLKAYPILLGFFVMSLLFYVLRRVGFTSKLERMLQNRNSLIFYAKTEVFIYGFLMIQLLAFSQSEDEIGIKLWGIKASLFSVIVLVIAVIYSLRAASLDYYMDKKHEMRRRLVQEKEDINKLWKLAFTDMLTGCGNRQLLDKRLEEYAGYGGSITLAFIDVNGLKTVNDQFGHIEGDNYLISMSQILLKVTNGLNIDVFRYGGDEFIMMSNSFHEEEMKDLLARTNELLNGDKKIHYERSVSYGVVRGECRNYQRLIREADELMYKHKVRYYGNLIRS